MILPKTSGDFEWVQESWGPALQSTSLKALTAHCFTTRLLKFPAVHDDDPTSWAALARALGVAQDSLIRLRQVHGAAVLDASVDGTGPPGSRGRDRHAEWPDADIAIGNDPLLGLTVRMADCVPILLADRRSGAAAAVHAGWRGTAAGAAMVAVKSLSTQYGARPEDIVAAVGPAIGPCCYVVGESLIPHFAAHQGAQRWFIRADRLRLDLWQATRDQLERSGVPAEQIHVCELCTSDHPELFHSYRRDGKSAGRLVAAIRPGVPRENRPTGQLHSPIPGA